MRARRTVLAAAVASAAALAGAGTALGAPLPHGGATGDPATITYYTAITNHFNAEPVNVEVNSGVFWLGYEGATQWYVSWDVPHRQYAFQHAVDETIVSRVVNRKITWETVTFAPGCAAGHVCVSTLVPVRFYLFKGGADWATLGGPNHTAVCWYKSTGSTAWINKDFNSYGGQPWYVGSSPFASAPNYRPMVQHGNVVKVTSTYKYNYGASVVELDTINKSTRLFTATTVTVSPIGKYVGYTLKGTIAVPKNVPRPPHIKLCT